jgi:DNA-binding transcriptional regulator/RsmH inhibitor MraZ
VFVGKHDRQLDVKGRLAIPAEYVKQLGGSESERKLVIAPGKAGCIWLVTQKHWEEKFEEFANAYASAIPGEFYHLCQERDVDKAGRILIDEKARELAQLADPAGGDAVQVVVAGTGRYIQVWRKDVYESRATPPAAFAQAVRP